MSEKMPLVLWTLCLGILETVLCSYSEDQCSWRGSGLSQESSSVEQISLHCAEGSLEWLYPVGALRLSLSPRLSTSTAVKGKSPRQVTTCIKPSSTFRGAQIYLERNGILELLLSETDASLRPRVHCFSWLPQEKVALFLQSTLHQDISRRIAAFRYELRGDWNLHLSLPSSNLSMEGACRPCNDTEILMAICTSDFGLALRCMSAVLFHAQQLRTIRKRPRKSREDLLREVIQQAASDNKMSHRFRETTQQWRETQSKRRDNEKKERDEQMQLRHVDCEQRADKHADRLLKVLKLQVEALHQIADHQEAQSCAPHPHLQLPPKHSTSSPLSPSGHYQQLPAYYHPQLPPTPKASPTNPQTQHPYSLHSTPNNNHRPPQTGFGEHSNSEGIGGYESRTYANL